MRTKIALLVLMLSCAFAPAADKYIHQLSNTTVSPGDLLVRDVESPPTVWKNYYLSVLGLYQYISNALGTVYLPLSTWGTYTNLAAAFTNTLGTAAFSNSTVFAAANTLPTVAPGTNIVVGTNTVGTRTVYTPSLADPFSIDSFTANNLNVTNLYAQNATFTNSSFYSNSLFYGPAYSYDSASSNGPAMNQFPTAGWVRSLLTAGSTFYNSGTTNANNTNYLNFESVIPATGQRVYTAVTNDQYVGNVVTTNLIKSISGQIVVSAYLSMQGGLGGPTLSVHPEIYYVYAEDLTNTAITTVLKGDWECANQNITTGTNLYSFVVPVVETIATNTTGFYLVRRFKIGVSTGATKPNLAVGYGTNTPGKITFTVPAITTATDIGAIANNNGSGTNVTLYSISTNRGNTSFPTKTKNIDGDDTNFTFSAATATYYVNLTNNMCITNITDLPTGTNSRFFSIKIDGLGTNRAITFQQNIGTTNLIGDLYSTVPYLITNKAVISVWCYGSDKTNILFGAAKQ